MSVASRSVPLHAGLRVPMAGPVLMVDVPLPSEYRHELEMMRTVKGEPMVFLAADLMTRLLDDLLAVIPPEPGTIVVFPGNGAQDVKQMSQNWRRFPSVDVFAKRLWQPGEDPVAIAGSIFPEKFICLDVRNIIVLDDAISSGLTFKKIHLNNAWKFPRARWIGGAWATQELSRSSDIWKAYSCIYAGCLIEGKDGKKTPLNSLSTLCEEPEMAEAYASRHFGRKKAGEFRSLVSDLFSRNNPEAISA